MQDLNDVVLIPINPEIHEWFIIVAKGFDFEITISKGNYVVAYKNPLDLYLFGCKMIQRTWDDFRTSNRMPVNPAGMQREQYDKMAQEDIMEKKIKTQLERKKNQADLREKRKNKKPKPPTE